jgi:proteasome activator subunit 4
MSEIHFSLVFYFRQVPLLSDARITEILEVGKILFICFRHVIETCQMLCKCLDDEVVEVREMAATWVQANLLIMH